MTARVTLTRTVIFIYISIFSQKPSFLKATAFSSLKAGTTDYTKFNKLCGDYTMWKIYKPSSRGLWLDIFHKGSGNKPSDFLLYPLISESKGTIAFLCHPGPTRAKTWFYTGRSSPQGMMQPCAAGGRFHPCVSSTCLWPELNCSDPAVQQCVLPWLLRLWVPGRPAGRPLYKLFLLHGFLLTIFWHS